MRSSFTRSVAVLSAVLLGVTIVACGSGAAPSATTAPTIPSGGSPADGEAAAAPTPATTGEYRELPLESLSPEAAAYLQTRQGPVGVAVVVPSYQTVYTWNGHEKFHMASVAKVSIMLTVMQQAIDAGRGLTPEELADLTPMITVSDNPSASRLWNAIGGGDAVEKYLRGIGLNEIDPNKDSCWGASYASATDAAMLFAKLATGEILDPAMRATATELLQQVDPSQTWGVIAAAPAGKPEGAVVAVKDGWYPADCGWWVNSAGMLIPNDGRPAYAMAVMTSQQVTWEYGIETIETVGRMVHDRLHGN